MRVTELISQLQAVLDQDGDIPVRLIGASEDTDRGVAGLSILADVNDRAISVMVCDEATLEALHETSSAG